MSGDEQEHSKCGPHRKWHTPTNTVVAGTAAHIG